MSQFRDAEAFLAELGIERDPINVPLKEPEPPALSADDQTPDAAPTDGAHGPEPSIRELAQLADEQPAVAPGDGLGSPVVDDPDIPNEVPAPLEDEVARAMNYIRRSVAGAPATEKKLRDRLADRGAPPAAIAEAILQARRERLVDDPAMAAALMGEWLDKGHAPFRIKQDLRKRGIPDPVIDQVLDQHDHEDPEARAFDVAQEVAARYRRLEPEAQFRRLVGHLERRGHAPAIARKVAREVVFADREDERTATR